VGRRPRRQKDSNLAELLRGQLEGAEIWVVLYKDWRSARGRQYSYMRWPIEQTRLCISVGPAGQLHRPAEAGATVPVAARLRMSAESETRHFE
jgi:hypothetical protein